MVSVNRSSCKETKNPIMFSGAVPKVPEVLRSVLLILFCSDRARVNSTVGRKKIKTDEDSFYSKLSFLWVFFVEFIISVSEMRWTFRQVSSDDTFKCGTFDSTDMRERKTTTSVHIGVVVFNLQSLFQFAGFSERISVNACWDKHFCLRGGDTFWHTCIVNNRVCV